MMKQTFVECHTASIIPMHIQCPPPAAPPAAAAPAVHFYAKPRSSRASRHAPQQVQQQCLCAANAF